MNRKMKDSGVEWIGKIPETWKIVPHKYIFKNVKGRKVETVDTAQEGFLPYITMAVHRGTETPGWSNPNKGVKVNKNDICVLWDGANAGEIYRISNEGLLSSTSAVLRLSKNNQESTKFGDSIVDKDYLYYYLKTYEDDLRNHTVGMGIPHVNGYKLLNDYMTIPHLTEQKKITTFLDKKTFEVDNIVEKTKQSIEELKAYKQSLITEVVTKGLNPDAPMKDSGIEWIGEIPVEWSRTKMKNVCSIGSGTTPKSSNDLYYNGDIYWIQSGDLYQKKYIQDTNKKITEKALNDTSSLRLFNAPYLVVAMYGASIGNVSISNIDATVNQAVGVIEPSSIDTKYLYYVLTASRPGFLQYSVGGTQPNISQTIINNWIVPLPPLDEQEHISKYLENITQQVDILINKKHQMIKELESYKQSLIYEYVTGKKEVE